MPKPLVPVAGVALIDGVIGNFRGAGITSLVIIVNEQARACRDWVHSRFPDLDIAGELSRGHAPPRRGPCADLHRGYMVSRR